MNDVRAMAYVTYETIFTRSAIAPETMVTLVAVTKKKATRTLHGNPMETPTHESRGNVSDIREVVGGG